MLWHVGFGQTCVGSDQNTGDVDRYISNPDDDYRRGGGQGRFNSLAIGVRMTAVPSDEICCCDTARKLLTRNIEGTVARRSICEHDCIVSVEKFLDAYVHTDLDPG